MKNTAIQWANHTFNAWIGCSKVDPGCANCYAEDEMDRRFGRAKWGPNGTRSKTAGSYWTQPEKVWNKEAKESGKRCLVFCSSLSDVFEDWQGPMLDHKDNVIRSDHRQTTMEDLRRRLFDIIDRTPYLTWLLLTKRPENVLTLWPSTPSGFLNNSYRDNVWIGTSVSDQETYVRKIPQLVDTRLVCAKTFVSAEPLLGRISMNCFRANNRTVVPFD
ncbi:MAG: DUF5131 family protein [Bdellovibrionales bacterium]|nr:DUF5131 family protein [Bdellovibrionales bacterium]